MTTLEEIIATAAKAGRVCPQPDEWHRLWELLPNRRKKGLGWEPSLPLILAAWDHTSDAEKRERFHLHLRWAKEHGSLGEVASFIASLKPEEWHTAN